MREHAGAKVYEIGFEYACVSVYVRMRMCVSQSVQHVMYGDRDT
jgi:hypothetical protein